MGRWSSNTFMMYIHNQIGAFAAGLTDKMSNHIEFQCITGPTVIDPIPSLHEVTTTFRLLTT